MGNKFMISSRNISNLRKKEIKSSIMMNISQKQGNNEQKSLELRKSEAKGRNAPACAASLQGGFSAGGRASRIWQSQISRECVRKRSLPRPVVLRTRSAMCSANASRSEATKMQGRKHQGASAQHDGTLRVNRRRSAATYRR